MEQLLSITNFSINYRQREREIALATELARADAYQAYPDRLDKLISDNNLGDPNASTAVVGMARFLTHEVLRRLKGDAVRKGQLIRFLHESDLIGGLNKEGQRIKAVIPLSRADLSGAILDGADLSGADLWSANLTEADLRRANLPDADLTGANLTEADLTFANLSNAKLTGTWLRGTSLIGTHLAEANLSSARASKANLTKAFLEGAILINADLSGVNLAEAILTDANVTNEQLAQAKSLVGATLPNGTKMSEKGWKEFKEKYR